MPDPRYKPNQPEYYLDTLPRKKVLNMNDWLELKPTNEVELKAIKESRDNYYAFFKSRISPERVDLPALLEEEGYSKEQISHLLGYNPNRSIEERNARNQMTVRIREKIFNKTAARFYGHLDLKGDRVLFTLMEDGEDQDLWERNKQLADKWLTQSPDERGELIEKRIQESIGWFNRVMEGGVTAEQVLDDFDNFQRMQDLASAMQVLRHSVESGFINVSPETRETMNKMERYAPLMDYYMQRLRIMASPVYEFMDIDPLVPLGTTALDDLFQEFENTYVMDDFLNPVCTLESWLNVSKRAELFDLIAQDFPVNAETPTIRVVQKDGSWVRDKYTPEADSQKLDPLGYSYMLVTSPSGFANCYRVRPDYRVEKSNAADMERDFITNMVKELGEAMDAVNEANKGFFIGSRNYRGTARTMAELLKEARALGDPPAPDKLARVNELLQKAVEKSQDYCDSKDPEKFKKAREENRYKAIKKVLQCCQRNMAMYDLSQDAWQAEIKAAMNFRGTTKDAKFPEHVRGDVRWKAHSTYADAYGDRYMKGDVPIGQGKMYSNVIADSDVGSVADNLRKDIHQNMEQALFGKNFDPQFTRDVMAKMVLLELVKAGRITKEDGKIEAGPLERELAQNTSGAVTSILNNRYFQAMTKNVSKEMMEHFVHNDGAKNIADGITKMAKKQASVSNEQIKPPVKKAEKPPVQ